MAGVQALFFGDFLLCQQKKVTRLSGRNPDGLLAQRIPPVRAKSRRGAPQGHTPPGIKARKPYRPALNAVNTRVCTRRIGCGTLSGAVMIFLSASLRKMVVFSATSFFTNFSEAAFGLA